VIGGARGEGRDSANLGVCLLLCPLNGREASLLLRRGWASVLCCSVTNQLPRSPWSGAMHSPWQPRPGPWRAPETTGITHPLVACKALGVGLLRRVPAS
jgi:hypothetical protein